MYARDPAVEWYALYFLIVSNYAFLPTIWRALQFRQYVRAFVFTGSLVSSSIYHLCKPENGVCLLPYHALGNFDFLFAILNMVITALYLVPFDAVYINPTTRKYVGRGVTGAKLIRPSQRHIETLIILSYAFIIAVLLSLGFNGVIAFLVVGVTIVLVVTGATIYNYINWHIRPHFDWLDLIIAGTLLLAGATLFIVQEYMSHHVYWIIHSIWHVLAAVGQFYLLDSRNWQHRGIIDISPVSLEGQKNSELTDPVYEQPAYDVRLIMTHLGYNAVPQGGPPTTSTRRGTRTRNGRVGR